MAYNERLTPPVAPEATVAHQTGGPAERVFTEFARTRSSWTQSRRVEARAEHWEAQPRQRWDSHIPTALATAARPN